jgi:hypothetical protein
MAVHKTRAWLTLAHRHVRKTRSSGTSPLVRQNMRRATVTGRYRGALKCLRGLSTL